MLSTQENHIRSSLDAYMQAADDGDYSALIRSINQNQRKFDKTDKTALMRAVQHISPKHAACINLLISSERGLRTQMGASALMFAAASGNIDAIKLLLPFEMNQQLSGEFFNCPVGSTALQIAAYYNRRDAVKLLFEAEAQLSQWDEQFLNIATNNPELQTVKMSKDSIQRTPLMYAIFCNNKIYKDLRQCSGVVDRFGFSALMYAVLFNRQTMIRDIVSQFPKELKLRSTNTFEKLTKRFNAYILACYLKNVPVATLLSEFEVGMSTESGQLGIHFLEPNDQQSQTLIHKVKTLEIGDIIPKVQPDELFENECLDVNSSVEFEDGLEGKQIKVSPENEMKKVQELLDVDDEFMILDTINEKKFKMKKMQDEILQIQQKMEEMDQKQAQIEYKIEQKDQETQDVRDRNQILMERIYEAMGEFKSDFCLQTVCEQQENCVQTDEISIQTVEIQHPDVVDKGTFVNTDEGVGTKYCDLLQNTIQEITKKKWLLVNLKENIGEERRKFKENIRHILKSYQIDMEQAEREVASSIVRKKSEQVNPFKQEVKGDQKKTLLRLSEYQNLATINMQLQQELEYLKNRNVELKKIIENNKK